jgi:hypothetical protein
MPMFDAYVFIDWSAANGAQPQQPSADAVWVGELIPCLESQRETYHRTRNAGVNYATSVLVDHVKEKRRVLVGFDFPYGYPAGFSPAIGLPSGLQSWWSVWAELADRVQDTANNVSNRFVAAGELNTIAGNGNLGPFWGCPVGTSIVNLNSRSPGFPFHATSDVPLQRLRIVEARLPGIQETWKLFGAGSVGSQALVGIPYVYQLRRHLGLVQLSKIWPFETQFTAAPSPTQGPFVLHAEIWPGVVEQSVQARVNADPALIRDQAQVRAMCEWAAECDEKGTLSQFFDLPNGLDQPQIQVCVEEEGWVLGAT